MSKFLSTGIGTVIFWDTCGLLDIYNDCVNIIGGNHITVLQKILAKTHTGNIVNFSADLLDVEFNDNFATTRETHTKKIKELVSVYNNLSAIAKKLNPYPAQTIDINDPEINILPNLDRLIQNLIDQIILIDRNDFLIDATERHVQKVPPGHHGFKDCIFWLQAIELKRAIGTAVPFYFITSNTKDYFLNNNIHPTIQAEATTLNIEIKKKIIDLYSLL